MNYCSTLFISFFLSFFVHYYQCQNFCYIPSQISFFCKSCKTKYYNSEFNSSDPNKEFLMTSCKSMIVTKYTENVYVDNSIKNCSFCTGTISNPYNNLGIALLKTWGKFNKNQDVTVSINLIGKDHFIKKEDFNKLININLFRRISIDLKIIPVYCNTSSILGCFNLSDPLKDINKPRIYLKTSSLHFFISNKFTIINIIFDGSDLQISDYYDDKYDNINYCNFDAINKTYNENPQDLSARCGLRNQQMMSSEDSYSLFNIEYFIEKSGKFRPNLFIYECEFILINSGYPSLISSIPWSSNIVIENTKISYNYFPGGILAYKSYDYFYSPLFNESSQFNSFIYNQDGFAYHIITIKNLTVNDNNYFNMIETNFSKPELISLFYLTTYSYQLFIFDSYFYNNRYCSKDYSISSSLIKFFKATSNELPVSLLQIENSFFENNNYPYHIWFSPNSSLFTHSFQLNLYNNTFSNFVYHFCYTEQPSFIRLESLKFFNINNLIRLFEFIQSSKPFKLIDCQFFNLSCPFSNSLLKEKDEIILQGISLIKIQTVNFYEADEIFTTQSSVSDSIYIQNNLFININCSIYLRNIEPINEIKIISSNFTNVIIPENSNYLFYFLNKIIFTVEFCYFNNIKSEIIFYNIYGKDVQIINSNFNNIESSIFRTSLYIPNSLYSIIMTINNCNFYNIKSSSDIFFQDAMFLTTGYVGYIINNTFINFSSLVIEDELGKIGKIVALNMIMENLNLTNLIFENFDSVQCVKISALIYKSSVTIFYFFNNSLFNEKSKYPSNFLEVLNFDEIIISFSNFMGSNFTVNEKSVIDIETGESRIEIINCNFFNLKGRFSVFFLSSNNILNLLIYKCTFINIEAYFLGGVIITFLNKNNLLSTIINKNYFSKIRDKNFYFDDCENIYFFSYSCSFNIRNIPYRYEILQLFGVIESFFHKCAGNLGGCFQMTENSQFYMNKVNFSNSYADNGGVISIEKNSELYMISIKIIFSSSNVRGGVIYLKKSKLKINNSIFIESYSNSGGGILASFFSIINLYEFKIYRSFSIKGGSLLLDDSILILENVFIEKSTGNLLGGGIFMTKGILKINNSYFSNCFSQIQGATYFLQTLTELILSNITIINSKCINNGIIYINSMNTDLFHISNIICDGNYGSMSCLFIKDSKLKISKGIFRNLTSSKSVILGISIFKKGLIILEDCLFYNIRSEENLILASGFTININFCLFHRLENIYFSLGKFLQCNIFINVSEFKISFLNFSSLISNGYFFDLNECQFKAEFIIFIGKIYLSVINGIDLYNIKLINCKFLEIYSISPSFYFLNSSILYLTNCLFFFLNSKLEAIIILEDMIFFGNNNIFLDIKFETQSYRPILYVKHDHLVYYFYLINTTFFNCLYQSINLNNLLNVTLIKLNVINKNLANLTSQFAVLKNIENLIIENSNFQFFNNLTIIELYSDNILNILFINNFLSDSYSRNPGGVFYIEGDIKMMIINSIFTNITSLNDGGIMKLYCNTKKSLLFINNSTFVNNTSFKSGGLINFMEDPLFFVIGTNYYKGNKGFTNDLFCAPPNKLYIHNQIIENKKDYFLENEFFHKQFEITPIFENFKSGDNLIFSVLVFDYFDNFLEFESNSFIEITNFETNSSYIQIISGKINIINGTANYENLQIIGIPGENYTLKLSLHQIFPPMHFYHKIKLHFRSCRRGEEFIGFQCVHCKKKYYLLIDYTQDDQSDTNFCKICEKNAECLGYYSLIPKLGFWRFDENSNLILRCKVDVSCPEQTTMLNLGSEEENYKFFIYKFVCGNGYEGNLCANCIEGYGKNSDNECILCSNSSWLYIKFCLFSLFMIFFMIFQAHSALSFQENESRKRSFLKIFVDHLSFISFIYRFNIDWAGPISEYFVINDKYINTTPKEIFNFNCFLTLVFNTKETTFYINSVLISFSPIFFGIITLIIWYLIMGVSIIINKVRQKQERKGKESKLEYSLDYLEKEGFFGIRKFKKNSLALFLVLYYNFYPRLILNGFIQFKCINLNNQNETYLEENPDLECWVGEHLFLIFTLAIPTLLIWGVLIPLIISLLAFKMTILMNITVKYQYWKDILNYITIDYANDKYYWETFLYLQKFLVVGFSISTSNLDASSQGGLMIMLFLFFFLIYEYYRPSKYNQVNTYRIYSYMTTICTIGFAILSSHSEITNVAKILYMSCLLIINLIFYIGWGIIFIKIQLSSYKQIAKRIAKSFSKIFTRKSIIKRNKIGFEDR